jgi:thiol-disulfide isomerase/thioredoxin
MLVGVTAARLARARTTAAGVNVAPVDHAGLLREVARHRGKVVVLDCWSTACPPCIKEFPGLVRLAAAHPDRVACLSLALDYDGVGTVAELLPPVREFLEKVGAHGVVNMIATDEVDVMVRTLDIVGVPAVFIWRPDGTLAACYDDDRAAKALGRPFTYADVTAAVEGLLAATGR